MNAVFDQHFVSGLSTINSSFKASQPERTICCPSRRKLTINESTGEITNLTDTEISHWGKQNHFESEHNINISTHVEDLIDNQDEDSIEELPTPSENENYGLIDDNGVRQSSRIRSTEDSAHMISHDLKSLMTDHIYEANHEFESAFTTLSEAAESKEVNINPYVPELKLI